jgi:hypothetical protein
METIRNYLETMFLKLPNTPEVYKAKNELWQMMEDKYTELKEEGKSENEAVGIVISEFGNLDELANDLGISQFVESQPMPQGKTLSLDQAKSYLADAGKSAYRTALGVMLCVLSVCGPIFFRCFYCILSAKRKSSGCMWRVHYVRTHWHCCWIIHLFQCTDEPLELFKERTFCY